jgi:hypothetical protein
MAEFLIANHSNTDPDGFQADDVIDVREDGWNWTRSELPRVVKLPAIPLTLAQQYREEDREIYVKVRESETKKTTGQLSLQRDDVETAKITVNTETLIKPRTLSVEDVGAIKILNIQSEELALEFRSVFFARRRWKMVGDVITDKLA